jgi:cytochrome c oxidase subunit 3
MLFTAFTAALLVRRTGTDWVRVALPPVVWANTAILVLSSVAVERARAMIRRDSVRRAGDRLAAAALLGVLFLAGQIVAWRTLVAQGILLGSNPHAAFFYTLSAVHAAHVLGGLTALGWTWGRARAGAYRPDRHAGLTHAAIYWHLVGGVWLGVLAVLSVL